MKHSIKDEDIIKKSVDELETEFGYRNAVIDKYAFDITINPATIIGNTLGGLVGSSISGKIRAKNQLRQSLEESGPVISMGRDHVEEVQNISNNIEIIFTPMSTLYMVKLGTRTVTLDTINTEEMDDEMYDAWRRRDAQYYKNLMLNKMMSEMQLVEQMYARRLLQKKMDLENAIKKKASDDFEPEETDSELGINEFFSGIVSLKEACEKNSKITEFLMKDADNEDEMLLSWGLDRPIAKYAGALSGAMHFFGMDTSAQKIKDIQSKFLNQDYLSKHLKIVFMPDRVMFVVDDITMTQISSLDMNEEGIKNFREQNQTYFRAMFMQQAKKGIAELKPKMVIRKKASLSGDISEIFKTTEVHPMIYAKVLDKKYKNWTSYDPEVLISEIERDFAIEDTGVNDLVLNKILTIQALRKSAMMFSDPLYFEKCVRSLTDKPVDFERWQPDNTGEEIMWTLQMMDSLTPGQDIFDNLSEDVEDYIIMCLVNQEYRTMLVKQSIINSEYERQFFETLNDDLLLEWNKMGCEKAISDAEVDAVTGTNESVIEVSKKVLQIIRQNSKIDFADVGYIVQQAGDKAGLTQIIINAVKKNVRLNLGVDMMIDMNDSELHEQTQLYNL